MNLINMGLNRRRNKQHWVVIGVVEGYNKSTSCDAEKQTSCYGDGQSQEEKLGSDPLDINL